VTRRVAPLITSPVFLWLPISRALTGRSCLRPMLCPEEVLLQIVELVFHRPPQHIDLHPRQLITNGAFALSLSSHQLRRICTPFLFQNIFCSSPNQLSRLLAMIREGVLSISHTKYVIFPMLLTFNCDHPRRLDIVGCEASDFDLKEEHCQALLAIIDETPSLQYIRLRSIRDLPSSLSTCNLLPLIIVDNIKVLWRTNLFCATLSNLAIKDFRFYINSRLAASRFSNPLFHNEISVVRLTVIAPDLPTIPFERLCFRGLRRIQIFMNMNSTVHLDWFPDFARRHALLDELTFSITEGWGWEKSPDIPYVNRLLGMFSSQPLIIGGWR
jgi:hypothetical protein